MATLKSLVDEIGNIKNELIECHTDLKNNLIAKGVECSDTDKMSSLVDRVGEILQVNYYESGENNLIYEINSRSTSSGMLIVREPKDDTHFFKYKCHFKGSIRLKFKAGNMPITCPTYVVKLLKSDGSIINISSERLTTNFVEYSVDVRNIELGDYILINIHSTSTYNTNFQYIRIYTS